MTENKNPSFPLANRKLKSPFDMLSSPTRKVTRSSLACLACRSRHVKCDGDTPKCGRCVETGKDCQYTQSRRGGLDRAALAARRKRLAIPQSPVLSLGSAIGISRDTSGYADRGTGCGYHEGPVGDGYVDDPVGVVQIPMTDSSQLSAKDIQDDPLILLYFQTFHKSHPFVLPLQHLSRLYRDASLQPRLDPLISSLRLIGNVYASKELSKELRCHVDAQLSQSSPSDPFSVQGHLLYSIVLFWFGCKDDSQLQKNAAVQQAIDLGMPQKRFAAENGRGDAVLEESWRRTWWMVYIVDAYYAGTLGTMNMAALDVDTTADLPCEEMEYQSGVSVPVDIVYMFNDPLTLSIANTQSQELGRL